MTNSDAAADKTYPPLSPFPTGLRGRCPRCCEGTIFDGLLGMKPACEACGLYLTVADTGDGPSFFASFIGGFVVVAAGVYAQIVYDPPLWVYVALLAVGALGIVAMLRPIKGVLTSLQFVNKAEQGVFEP